MNNLKEKLTNRIWKIRFIIMKLRLNKKKQNYKIEINCYQIMIICLINKKKIKKQLIFYN